jgi:quercetin dioxygenase-like cupin family protein
MPTGAAAQPHEGEILDVMGDKIIVKLDREQTNGQFAVIEEVTAPGAGIPLHRHEGVSETFFILEGELEFQCGDTAFRASKGTVAYAPKGVPHGFKNIGSVPARQLVTVTPPDFVDFFRAVHRLSQKGPPGPEQLEALTHEYDVAFVL